MTSECKHTLSYSLCIAHTQDGCVHVARCNVGQTCAAADSPVVGRCAYCSWMMRSLLHHATRHIVTADASESETSWDYSSILSAARDDGVKFSGTMQIRVFHCVSPSNPSQTCQGSPAAWSTGTMRLSPQSPECGQPCQDGACSWPPQPCTQMTTQEACAHSPLDQPSQQPCDQLCHVPRQACSRWRNRPSPSRPRALCLLPRRCRQPHPHWAHPACQFLQLLSPG